MERKEFQAESKRLLELMIHSIYTHKEIFLREILSNASDAIDKLCYRSLTDEQVGMKREDFAITIRPDQEARTLTVSDNGIGMDKEEIVRIAVKSMGLDDLKPFDPAEKVIEYLLEAEVPKKRLIDMTCKGFAEETASESPAPGGGSIAAYMGALGAALGTMVANLSSHKAGWDDRWEEFSDWAERGQAVLAELLHLVDEDTAAFNRIMAVFAMPKSTDEEKAARSAALQEATLYATEVPLRTMKAASRVFEIVRAMASEGNPNSVSDAGVGALAARSAVLGACLNVKINAAGLKDRAVADALTAEAEALAAEAVRLEAEVLQIVESKIG